MQNKFGSCSIDIPDTWIQTAREKKGYFESDRGDAGLYISENIIGNISDSHQIFEYVRQLELEATKSIKGYYFEVITDSKQEEKYGIIGILDLYDKSNSYRIVTRFLINQQTAYRVVLHDYCCENHVQSVIQYNSIIESMVYSSSDMWVISKQNESKYINEVCVNECDGFVDIALYIDTFIVDEDGSCEFNIACHSKDYNIGFSIQFGNNWHKKELEDSDIILYWGDGKFVSHGDVTVGFIKWLAEIYGVEFSHVSKDEVNFTVVGLNCDPRMIKNQDIRTKLFFNEDNEDLYSEVFLNISQNNKRIDFNEKDADYRSPLIQSLCGFK